MGKPRPGKTVKLDGRTLEGGGQLLRIAVCLSALTGTPIQIDHIRGNRGGGGGLKAQHLACVNWLGQACHAKVTGAKKGSTTLTFEPGEGQGDPPAMYQRTTINGSEVYQARLEIGTSGSTGLALQAILPFVLFSPSVPSDLPLHLILSGGTNVSASPSYEYITQVLLPILHTIGLPKLTTALLERGWSTSIGAFTLEIPAGLQTGLSSFTLSASRSPPETLQATFLAPESSHEHFRSTLQPAIAHHFGSSVPLHITCEDSHRDKRMYFILVATFPDSVTQGRDWLYDRKIRDPEVATTQLAEKVTEDLAKGWRQGDEHLQDQLVIFQALAEGSSAVEVAGKPSLHTRTAWWVAERMLGLEFDEDGSCEGIGFGRAGVVDKMENLGLDD